MRSEWRRSLVEAQRQDADGYCPALCIDLRRHARRESRLSLPGEVENDTEVNLLSDHHSEPTPAGVRSMLEGYAYRCYRSGGLDYLLRRSDV